MSYPENTTIAKYKLPSINWATQFSFYTTLVVRSVSTKVLGKEIFMKITPGMKRNISLKINSGSEWIA